MEDFEHGAAWSPARTSLGPQLYCIAAGPLIVMATATLITAVLEAVVQRSC